MNLPAWKRMRSSGILLMAALLGLLGQTLAAEENPAPVPVGQGSYASFPPKQGGGKSRDMIPFLERELFVDESQKGAAIPTNDWWTDLIYSRYAGNMWAYPFTVSANETGIKIFLPTRWNNGGNGLELEAPLVIGGKVAPSPEGPEWILLGDFDGEKFPEGWRTSGGEGFGDGPTQGAAPGQTPVSGFAGTGLANSIHGGDRSVGVLTSPKFSIGRNYLHFLAAGGNDEKDLSIQLVIDGKAVKSATGENSETLKWRTWDLAEWKGRSGQLVATDRATGGWGHILLDQVILSDQPKPPRAGGAEVFQPESAKALRWSDWLLTFRMEQSPAQRMDVTMGRGLPYVWLESTGVDPVINLPEGALMFDSGGNAVEDPARLKRFGLEIAGHFFGLVSPAAGNWKKEGNVLTLVLGGKPGWLAVAALPKRTDLARLADHATAIPRGSRMDWTYRPDRAEVETRWTLETQILEGPEVQPLQGWLPHHYRSTQNSFKFEEGLDYATPRGLLRLAPGKTFQITWPFKGIVPALPAPKEEPDPVHGFKLARMKEYLRGYADKIAGKEAGRKFGADTYWGAKDLLLAAHYMVEAKLLGDETYPALHAAVGETLKNWLTYTPGEDSYYFARYPKFGAMVGFDSSYGSYNFTDNHFHYGYFTYAAALLGMVDADFLRDYGGMARLVAKQYANWDRNDTAFPFVRTFDVWGGHSYAGGMSSGGGNNQESSSEAMQSWAGLFFLGDALLDREMTAAAAMGYAMESSATMEYWNDYYGWKNKGEGANFPPGYKHSIVGILGDSGMAFGTFFHGHPMFIYGIQWLPLSPALDYLGRDPEFARYQLDNMLREQAEAVPGFTFSKLGHDWGNVTLGYLLQFDPEDAAKRLQEFRDQKDPIAVEAGTTGQTYYLAHALRQLGGVQWKDHTDAPSSTVYGKDNGAKISCVIYNPDEEPKTVTVYRGGTAVGTVLVPARTLLRADELQPIGK